MSHPDSANFIAKAVVENCPEAVQCADPFHVVKWATEALDEVRRQSWNEARRLARRTEPSRGRGRPPADAPPREASARAKALKGARFALNGPTEDERRTSAMAGGAARRLGGLRAAACILGLPHPAEWPYRATVRKPVLAIEESGVLEVLAALRYRLQ